MNNMQKYGSYAFLIGIVLAIIAAFVAVPMLALVLAILGLIVGLLNVSDKETMPFLVAAIALGMGSAALAPFSTFPLMDKIVMVFQNIAVFVAPAAFIVAIKAIWTMAKDA